MKLELLRTYVTLTANNHNVKPKIMTIGGFNIVLDNINVCYDNGEFGGGWSNESCQNMPTIEWLCYNGSEVYSVNGQEIDECENYVFNNFAEIPTISSILEIHYEAFTNIAQGIEFEFYPIQFSIEVIDRETNKHYTIEASDEVLQDYIKHQIDVGFLTKTK